MCAALLSEPQLTVFRENFGAKLLVTFVHRKGWGLGGLSIVVDGPLPDVAERLTYVGRLEKFLLLLAHPGAGFIISLIGYGESTQNGATPGRTTEGR
jgi:hypothetical protein